MHKWSYRILVGIFLASLMMLLFGVLCWAMPMMMHPWYSRHLLIRVAIPGLIVLATFRELMVTARLCSAFKPSSNDVLHKILDVAADSLGIAPKSVKLIENPLPLALCIGLFKPTIVISTGLVQLLSRTQLQAVLLHEYYHVVRRDPLRTLGIDVLRAALFFLPAIKEWHQVAKAEMEMQADNYAAGRVGKAALAGALHRLLCEENGQARLSGATAGLSINALRVASLLGEASTPNQISRRSLLISTAILWVLCMFMI